MKQTDKEMLCPSCHTPNAEAATFCTHCGAKMAASQEPAESKKADVVSSVFDLWSSEQTTRASSLTGKTIDNKYQVESQIGKGGMGTVFRARRLLIGDTVAIKILNLSKDPDPLTTERFRREAQAAARLKHPNAVSIYDFGISADGLQYLVMELVEGESLRAMIKRNGPMAPSSAAEILSQVCSALDEAHRHGIVHRDIKPDNIFVSRTDRALRVKVLDFGIAKLKDPVATNLTLAGSVMGTPHYMSPEQCLGEELDHRSDIYSLGIVTYEMLTGRVPFNSPTSTAVVIQHVNHPPPALHLIRSDITPAVEAVVLHALEKRREMRPQSAGELANEFAAAVNGIPTVQSPRQPYETPTPSSIPAHTAEPTLVLGHAMHVPQYISGPRPQVHPPVSPPPPSNITKTVVLTAIATILLISLGGMIAWIATMDSGNANNRNETANNANGRAQTNTRANENMSSSTPTPSTNTNMAVTNTNTQPSPVDNSAQRSQVMALMNRWADSLRRRNLYDNLSCYSDYLSDFYGKAVSKDSVRTSRQKLFTTYYSSADVQLSNVQVSFDSSGSTATVKYTNTYDWRGGSSFLRGKSDNEIQLSKSSGQWLITSEKHLYSYFEDKGP